MIPRQQWIYHVVVNQREVLLVCREGWYLLCDSTVSNRRIHLNVQDSFRSPIHYEHVYRHFLFPPHPLLGGFPISTPPQIAGILSKLRPLGASKLRNRDHCRHRLTMEHNRNISALTTNFILAINYYNPNSSLWVLSTYTNLPRFVPFLAFQSRFPPIFN